MLKSLLFGLTNFEIANIAIQDNMFFSLLSVLTSGFDIVFRAIIFLPVGISHDFSADEEFLEVGMDDTTSLWSFATISESPASNFVFTGGKEMNEL